MPDRLALAKSEEPRERACEIMLLLEGSLALTLIHGQRRYFDAAARAAKRLLPGKARTQCRDIKKKKPGREGSGPVEFMPARDCWQSPSRGESLSAIGRDLGGFKDRSHPVIQL